MKDLNSPTTIASFPHEMEAGMLSSALEQQGIESRIVGSPVSGFRAESPAFVEVVVAFEHVEKAKQIAEQLRAEEPDVDWSKVDVGVPVEGADSEAVIQGTSSNAGKLIFLFLFLGFLLLLWAVFDY